MSSENVMKRVDIVLGKKIAFCVEDFHKCCES